jgi:Na+-driven multidrug efflux pump
MLKRIENCCGYLGLAFVYILALMVYGIVFVFTKQQDYEKISDKELKLIYIVIIVFGIAVMYYGLLKGSG